jgi:hypothetical protein
MIDINIFSGKVYTTVGDVKVSQDGKTFVKSGEDWIGTNGDFIQQTSNGLLNSRTGIASTYGDPFGDDHE